LKKRIYKKHFASMQGAFLTPKNKRADRISPFLYATKEDKK
jgi:hypothetical protein